MLGQVVGAALTLAIACEALSFSEALKSRPELSRWTEYVTKDPTVVSFIESVPNITCIAPNNDVFERYTDDPPSTSDSSTDIWRDSYLYSCFYGAYNSSDFGPRPQFFKTLLNSSNANPNQTKGLIHKGGMPIEITKFDNGTISVLTQPIPYPNDTNRLHSGPRQQPWIVEPDIDFDGGVLHITDDFVWEGTDITLPLVGQLYNSDAIKSLSTSGVYNDSFNYIESTSFVVSNANFTVFESLTKEQQAVVRGLVRVVGETYYSDAFTEAGNNITTQEGSVILTYKDGEYYVNNCRVLARDAITVNGVAHLTECYPVPPGSDIPQGASNTPATS